jgi:hypothetical protein
LAHLVAEVGALFGGQAIDPDRRENVKTNRLLRAE